MNTAWLLAAGEQVWRGPQPALTVPPGHVGVVCGGCAWYSLRPTREAEAELLRVAHCKAAHGPEIQAGEFTVHLAEYVQSDGRLRFSPLSEAV